ncbi:MAG: hypothetical protein ACKVQC_05420 [Elusimicrobiota bacterium]
MRITIGHLLLVGVVGAGLALGPLRGGSGEKKSFFSDLRQSVSDWMGFFKSSDSAVVPLTSLNTIVEEKDVVLPLVIADPAVETEVVIASSTVQEVKVEEAPLVTSVSAKVKRKRKRKKVVAQSDSSVFVNAPASKPVTKSKRKRQEAVSPYLGTMVNLELKGGRVVPGILLEKTATSYKVELPGLGPFEYPISNVVSIKPAQ